ncbi:HET-domain-containing protein, partial [Alternaria alternata]
RLIYLHPGGFDDDIYCTIYHANILEKLPQTEYTALSYVWGDAKHTKPIQLGYHQIPTITKNLEKALRHLRDRASERILWVDAICINQSDEEEKLSQVQSMGDVYRNAVEVRIWLGSLKDVQEEANDEQFPNELQALGIRIIAMQPWWRRVWVIQEATLPKEDPIMQCGNI